jgi:hypothetical protein
MPAGEYRVYTVLPAWMIRITSADGRHSAIVTTVPRYASAPSENSRLIQNFPSRAPYRMYLDKSWSFTMSVSVLRT